LIVVCAVAATAASFFRAVLILLLYGMMLKAITSCSRALGVKPLRRCTRNSSTAALVI